MGRKVKCCVTGEYGTSDSFVKINGKYYKSQEVYDNHMNELKTKDDLYRLFQYFLGYEKNQPLSTIYFKRLKELEYYTPDVILETAKEASDSIDWAMTHKEFKSDFGRITYIFAIVKNNIADVNRKMKREKNAQKRLATTESDIYYSDIENGAHGSKDISKWLDDVE